MTALDIQTPAEVRYLSNEKNLVDIPLYWLVDRDPYNGLL